MLILAMENKKSMKRVEDRVTNDLGQTEEAVFEVIALNPGESMSRIKEKYGLSTERVLSVTDSLVEKGFVRQLAEDEGNDLVWEVTELGRLMLMKYYQVMRFDVMEAKLRGQREGEVEELERKKKAFENAYRQCKVLFE